MKWWLYRSARSKASEICVALNPSVSCGHEYVCVVISFIINGLRIGCEPEHKREGEREGSLRRT